MWRHHLSWGWWSIVLFISCAWFVWTKDSGLCYAWLAWQWPNETCFDECIWIKRTVSRCHVPFRSRLSLYKHVFQTINLAPANKTEHESTKKLLGYSTMERFFRSLKTENMPKPGYSSITCATKKVKKNIFRYYNSVRTHTHNMGLSPNAKDEFYWATSYSLPKRCWSLLKR